MAQHAKISFSRSKYLESSIVNGTKLLFSAHRCFSFDDGPEDRAMFERLSSFIKTKPRIAIAGVGELTKRLLAFDSTLADHVKHIISDDPELINSTYLGIKVVSPDSLPKEVEAVFHGQTLTVLRGFLARKLPAQIDQYGPEILTEIDLESVPKSAWTTDPDCIYPLVTLPEFSFLPNQDLILIDCPARNLSLMPNGLAYVHNALKKTNVKFQTVDLDILVYHRYHTYRLLDVGRNRLLRAEK